MTQKEIIVLKETTTQSIIRDTYTFLMLVSLIGVGKWIDSTAMQWVGAFLGIILVSIKSMVLINGSAKLTIQQAREKLDELEASE